MTSGRVEKGELNGEKGGLRIQQRARKEIGMGVGAGRKKGEHLTRRDSCHSSNHDACD